MKGMTRSDILACMDALALEIASKIADYKRLEAEVASLREQVKPSEDHPRNLDTHEMVSRLIPRRRTA